MAQAPGHRKALGFPDDLQHGVIDAGRRDSEGEGKNAGTVEGDELVEWSRATPAA